MIVEGLQTQRAFLIFRSAPSTTPASGVEITTYTLLTPLRKSILSSLDAAAVEAPNIQLVSLQCSLAATNRARSGEEGRGGERVEAEKEGEKSPNFVTSPA